jgi:hypothetical protein
MYIPIDKVYVPWNISKTALVIIILLRMVSDTAKLATRFKHNMGDVIYERNYLNFHFIFVYIIIKIINVYFMCFKYYFSNIK